MIAADTSFLVDYLDGVQAAGAYVEANRDEPITAPSLSLFEVYRGAARADGRDQVEQAASNLSWIDPLPLDDPAAREAAVIEAELLESGDRINLGDVLVAGVCRRHGARIVTSDSHFDRVDGLDVDDHREQFDA